MSTLNKEKEDELRTYIKRMEADNNFKDAKIRRLEGEIRILKSEFSALQDVYADCLRHRN